MATDRVQSKGFDIIQSLKSLIEQIERGDFILHNGTWTQHPNYHEYNDRGLYHICFGPDELEIKLYISRTTPPPKGLWAWEETKQAWYYDYE